MTHIDASPALRRSRAVQYWYRYGTPTQRRAKARELADAWVWADYPRPNYVPKHAARELTLVGAIPSPRRSSE